ncbi:hypothetical protein ACIHFE_18380 [Streptomyces sp. NPDC052396]|uniref:hypothetical protein n=1 Tax=Streptomyces sp. NPDC052396 TaxID=3365689 RepID=UPI0037CE92EB
MRSTRRFVSTLVLVAALGGGLAACNDGKKDTSDSASSSKPADHTDKTDKSDKGKDGNDPDCGGKPPVMPAGHTMIAVTLERDASKGFDAQVAKPVCTPNDWAYHGEGEAKHYTLAADVKAELALMDGPNKTKPVSKDDLTYHIDQCHSDDHSRVKAPFGCFGNVYDITMNGKGEIKTIKELWHV